MISSLKEKDDEEYKKRLEEARKIRQSMGIVTSRDIENGYNVSEKSISSNISLNENSDYQKKLEEARKIRHSMGIITPREISEFEKQFKELNSQYENNNMSVVEDKIEDNSITMQPIEENTTNEIKDNEKNIQVENESIIDRRNKMLSANLKDETNLLEENKIQNQSEEIKEENQEKNTNIFQDIGGFFKALFSGAKVSSMQAAHSLEVMNEQVPQIEEQIDRSYITSQKAQAVLNKNKLNELDAINSSENSETNLIKKYIEEKIKEENQEIQQNANKMSNDFSKKIAGDILPSVGQMGLARILDIAVPSLGMSYMYTSAMGSYYDEGIQRGMTEKQATTFATTMAGFEALTEELTFSNFGKAEKGIAKLFEKETVKDVTKRESTNLIKDVFKDYGIGIAENFAQEAVIEPLQEITSQVVSGSSNWKDMGQRMLKSGIDGGIVAALTGGADLGITSCINVVEKLQRGEKLTNREYKNAIQDLCNNPNIDIEETIKDSILYQIKNSELRDYYKVNTNSEGNIEQIQEVLGKPIENINRNLNVEPIIIRNTEQNTFNIIDKDTGLLLDSSPYETLEEAENGFYKKIYNLDNATIKKINNKLIENKVAVSKFMTEVAEDIANNYQNIQNNNINNSNNESNISNINSQNNTITQNSEESSFSMKINNNNQLKEKQLEIIKNSNPMQDDIHTGIRSVEDIKTFQEALQDKEWSEYEEFDPDYTMEMAKEAIDKGKITVYSSYPIEQGAFVTPSRMEAESYSGDGQIYSQEMDLKDIAWIDPTQGQVAINNNKLSKQVDISSNRVYNKISDKEKSQIKSEVMTWRKNSSDGINFIDLSKDGYFSYSYMKKGDDIQVLQKFIGDEDFIKEAREVVLNETYSESQGLNQYLKNVRSRLKNNTSNNASSSRRQKSSNSIGKNITDGRQQRRNNNTENISRNNKIIKDEPEKTNNIEYNSKGIRLNKTEYANVISLINTNKPNLRGTQTISSSDYFYMYESDSFDNNKVIIKIKIDGNEDLINAIRRGIEDGTIDSTEKAIRSLEEYARHGRRLDNSDNDISQRTTKNRKINRLYIRDVENGKETRQGQNSKQSNRDKPGIENSNQSSFSMQENNDNVRSMKQKQETDNQGRKLSKEQQEFFKDSKVRDKNGNLKVVYHGTKNGNFTVFDVNKIGTGATSFSSNGSGFYFTENKEIAKNYAGTIEGNKKTNELLGLKNTSVNPQVYETYINITNPFVVIDNTNQKVNYILKEFSKEVKKDDVYNPEDYQRYKNLVGADILSNVIQNKGKEFTEFIKRKGFDGIQYSAYNYENNSIINNYIVFSPNQIKNVDNISPTSNEDIRYMKKSNTTKKEIKVDPSIQKELHNRIQNSLLSNNSRKNTFLGKVTEKVVHKVKQLYGIDISGRNHIISDYDIRHIIKQHGNPITEKAKGQIAVTTKDIEKIPDIIINYDKIEKGTPNTDSFTKKINNTIRYIKEYDNNTTYLVEVIPSDNNKLNIKTMWKKPVTLTNSQKTPSSTSKTRGNLSSSTLKNNSSRVSHDNNKVLPYTPKAEPTSSYSYDSISQNMENVKENKIPEVKTNAERGESYIEQEIQKLEKTGQWDDTIPVTKLRDINNVIEDYLGLGIKKGRFRERAFGIYKGKRDVIRVKEFKDIDTILHETGHALDIGNRIKIDKENIAGELINAIDRRGGYEDAQREIKLEEGFAEVIREYGIVPERARADAPQTIAILEEMRKQDKDFDNFINKVQTLSYNYIHQNPQNRVQSNISIGEQTDKKKWDKDSIRQAVAKTIWDKDYVIKDVVNNYLKKDGTKLNASENAYLLTRLSSGIGNKVTSMLADGYIDENGNRLFPGLNKLGEILDNDPQRFNDLRDYLVAKSDLDYKSKSKKTGIRTTDSLNTINKFKNDTQIQEAAQIVYDTLDGVLQYAVNNNFISEETAEKFRKSNAFYVPMQRVLENDRGNNVGRRGAVQEAFKKRKGSELDIKDPLENIVANSANIIQQVENNNVLKALYKQGESVGLTGAVYDKIATPMTKISTQQLSIWEKELSKQGVDTSNLDLEKAIDMFAPNNRINTNDKIANFIDDDGNRIYLQFNDKEVFNALMGIDSKMVSTLLNISSKLNMPLRYGATMANVGFAIPNMISDTIQATIYSEAGFVPIVDNAIGVLDVLAATNENVNKFMQKVAPEYAQRINNIYKLYQQSGASSSTRLSQYRKSSQELMPDIYGTKSKSLGIDEKFKPLKRLLDIMTYISELSEQSDRLRVFERNYDFYKKQGNTEMDSRIMAAIESRDATQDFGRMGTLTSEINKVIPFSAARMGSLLTFSEKIKANPKKVSFRIAMLATLAMAIKGLGYDDKEIEELNQRKKDDNFVIKVGDTIMTFKKPQGILRSIVNLTEYIQDLVTGHIESGKEGERLGEWLSNAIMDNMPADEISGLIPNAIAPVIENAINKDLYYNTEIVKSYDEDLPNYMQYYEYNSQLAIWLGKIFNYSPAKIDNLISGYFGGLGTQVTNVIDWVSGKLGLSAEEPNMGAEENAVGKRFVVNVNNNSQSIDDVYNLRNELTKKQNGGTITEEETQQLEKIKNAISKISGINKQIKAIKQDLTMSANAKADAIRPLQEQKTDTARDALGKELIHQENKEKIEASIFYPSQNILSLNGNKLELTEEMKKEYENIAYSQYKKYKKQGIYSQEYLEKLESKCKEYAKKTLMQKYKGKLVKTK